MKSKILIIDDEPDNLEYMARVLEKMSDDCDIFQSNDGLMGYEVIEKEQPDLVITDWQMPNTGIDLIKRMRQQTAYKYIPVIVYSGFVASSENLIIALQAGATDYVNKPIRPMELIARSHVLMQLYQDRNENKYTASNKIIYNFLQSEITNTYTQLKGLIPQIANKNTEFDALKLDLNSAIDEVKNAPDTILLPLQKFLLTNSSFEVPHKENFILSHSIAQIQSKLEEITRKKNITVIDKYPSEKKVFTNLDILNFMLWITLKECYSTITEDSKVTLKEGKSKAKNKTCLSLVLSYKSFPKEVIQRIEELVKADEGETSGEINSCINMLKNLTELTRLNDGDLELQISKWKGIRLNIHFPTA